MSVQRRHKSVCSPSQPDLSPGSPHEETLYPYLSILNAPSEESYQTARMPDAAVQMQSPRKDLEIAFAVKRII